VTIQNYRLPRILLTKPPIAYYAIIVNQRNYNETFPIKMHVFLFKAVNGCFHSNVLISLHGPYRRVSFLLGVLDNSEIFKHFFPSESYVEFAYVVGEHKTQNMIERPQ